MTEKEAKAAFLAHVPVTHGGITYDYISALGLRWTPNGRVMVLELFEEKSRCVVVARTADVREAKGDSGAEDGLL